MAELYDPTGKPKNFRMLETCLNCVHSDEDHVPWELYCERYGMQKVFPSSVCDDHIPEIPGINLL